MQGIDEHTLLYLKGDSFNDLSLNQKTVTATDVSIVDDDLFGKSFKSNTGVIYVPTKEITLDGDTSFTIEWFENLTSADDAGIFNTNERLHHGLLLGYYEEKGSNIYCSSDGNSWNVIRREVCGGKTFNKWIHKAFCYSKENLTLYCFENGIKTYEKKLQQELSIYCGERLLFFDAWTNKVNANISNIRISNVSRWTEDFELPTEPYDYSPNIEIIEQTEHHISFNVLENTTTVNKVKVYINNKIEKEYTDTFENLIFDIIYDEKYIIGKNEIKFVIEYNDTKNIKKKVYHYRQRIDENTVFFLNGKDIVDSSYNPKVISNNGVTMSDGGKFGKFYNMESGYLQIQNFNPHFRNFSVEFYLKFNTNSALDVLFDTRNSSHNKGYVIYIESNKLKFQIDKDSSLSSFIDYSSFDKNIYHHFVFEVKDYKYVKMYHNGKFKKLDTLFELPQEHISNNIYMSRRCDEVNKFFTHELSMFKISNINIYNEDFIPTNIVYCYEPTLSVDQTSESQLKISIEDMSNVMNKLEIFINGNLKNTIVEDFNNIYFDLLMKDFDDGFNEIELLITFNNIQRIIKRFKIYKYQRGIIVANKYFKTKEVLFDKEYTHFKPFILGNGNINILYSINDSEYMYCDINNFTQINSNNIKLMFLMNSEAVIEAYKIYVTDCIDVSSLNFDEILPPPNDIEEFPGTGGSSGSIDKEEVIKIINETVNPKLDLINKNLNISDLKIQFKYDKELNISANYTSNYYIDTKLDTVERAGE